MSSVASLQRRPRARAALSAGGRQVSRVDANPLTRAAALRALPQVLARRFDPQVAGGLSAQFELRVMASPGGPEARFAVSVGDGAVSVERRAAPEAAAWIAVSLGDMIRLISHDAQVWELMAAKRLALGGEPFTVMRFPGLFGI